MSLELPLLDAVEQASREHDDWLGSIGRDHPWIGWGAPAGEVAQVLFHGMTFHAAWEKAVRGRGLRSLGDIGPWAEYERVRDELWAEAKVVYETNSERCQAVAQLRRAERLGLIARRKTHPSGGHLYWSVAST